MKQINYDSQTLVTGDAVAEALLEYAVRVGQMGTTESVEIPVLEANGVVSTHTLLVGQGVLFEVTDVDGAGGTAEESGRFPVPEFTPVGGQAVATPAEELDDFVVQIDDDVLS